MLNNRDGSLNWLYQWLILALLFPLVFLNGWLVLRVLQYFEPIFTILILASLLAFILNYPVKLLQQRGLQRQQGVILVFLMAALGAIALAVTLIPLLLEQVTEIAGLLPDWINSGSRKLQALQDWAASRHLPSSLTTAVSHLADRLPGELQTLGDNALNLLVGTINDISEAILTAVLTFYLLLDGDRIWNGIFQRLPASFGPQVQQSLQQNFQNYFLGQVTLASLVGATMTVLFLILRVPYGLLFGLGVGALALIPFGDIFSLLLVSLLLSTQDFWLAVKVLAGGTLADQFIDQIIAPRLLGRFTGLRPIWIIIGLLVGTKIGGLLGLLVAVPLASFIKDAIEGFPDYLPQALSTAANPELAGEIPATVPTHSNAS